MGTSNISLSLITMPRTWAVDMTPDSADSFRRVELASPPGYSKQDANDQDSKVATKRADQTQLKIKKAKELAWQPAKSFMMTGFMLWMSGNGVHIFSIMITFYAIYNPIKSACGVNGSHLCAAQYGCDAGGAIQNVVDGIAAYHASRLGLLPRSATGGPVRHRQRRSAVRNKLKHWPTDCGTLYACIEIECGIVVQLHGHVRTVLRTTCSSQHCDQHG